MKSKSDSMEWIPLWVDKWIFGTTRIELEPDERSVWVDLMAVAAKDHGFIRANVGVAYPPQQLSGLLCITEELLLRAIEKCIKVGKLCQCENGGGYYLPNWGEYQLSERHKRRFKEKIEQIQALSSKTDIVAENENKNGPIGEDIKKRRGEDIKKKLGEFENVKLTEQEYQKLIKKFGESSTKERIENLSDYLASKGKKYANHYATILAWERKNPTPIKKREESKNQTPAMIKCKFCGQVYKATQEHQCQN